MEKHYLATVSNDIEHLFGVRFICTFFNKMSEIRVTLFHICRGESVKKTLMSNWDNPKDVSSAPIPPEAKKTIQKAQKFLSHSKVPVDNVMTKTVVEKYGKVKDILAESARGHYDAIVLGRRASYTLQWMFDRPSDETFQCMIKDNSCVSPLWICPDIDPQRKNVLVCIDGSQNGYLAVVTTVYSGVWSFTTLLASRITDETLNSIQKSEQTINYNLHENYKLNFLS